VTCKDASEKVIGFRPMTMETGEQVVVCEDITERKRAEEELRESEERYRTILESIEEGYYEVDIAGNFTFFNNSLCGILGYSEDELMGMNNLQYTDKETAKEVYQAFNKVYTRGRPARGFDWEVIRKDGTKRHVETSISPMKDKEGRPDGFRGIVRDITERVQAEEELKRSQEELRNLADHLQSVREQERTNIAREIHDDLGQTLTALKMDISWLRKKLPKDQETLLEKTKAMTKLTDMTIKTVKRISTELRPGLLDDLGLVAAIEWQAEEFKNRTGITYKLTIDPEEIILDPDRSTTIFRIFQETLTNIARHAKATRVTITLKEKDDKVALRVRDNGKGITEKQISHPKSFGLMGIRERVHPWEGQVKISGKPGEGTTVVVRIPIETG
jgi:two-component system sensor histidine kinase UhpB